jgi:hypothetical protein
MSVIILLLPGSPTVSEEAIKKVSVIIFLVLYNPFKYTYMYFGYLVHTMVLLCFNAFDNHKIQVDIYSILKIELSF